MLGRMRWAMHIARVGEISNVCNIFFGKLERQGSLGIPRGRLEDTMKVYSSQDVMHERKALRRFLDVLQVPLRTRRLPSRPYILVWHQIPAVIKNKIMIFFISAFYNFLHYKGAKYRYSKIQKYPIPETL
jgi:hypothetical protein